MSEKIEVNYESLGKIGQSFDQHSNDLQSLFKQIDGKVNDLRGGGWLGEGANAFYHEMDNQVLPALTRLYQAVQLAQQTVQHIVKDFEAAEHEAQAHVQFKEV